MTKYQLGILVGFFLGALVLLVVLGIIFLYIEERQEKRDLVREPTGRDTPDNRQALSQ
jgi:hypothetical protein